MVVDVLNVEFPVDGDGFIRLVSHLGNDMAVIKSARVSYGDESKGPEADQRLIEYLMKHNHGTPFEHLVFTFHVRCPIFVARQWFRHRIGSFNEISLRYTTYAESEFWHPQEWRTNDKKDKQDSSKAPMDQYEKEYLLQIYQDGLDAAEKAYRQLLDAGVAREQARAVLPVATYTEFYWTVNARSLFNFIKLRGADSAQAEIRGFVPPIVECMEEIAPWTLEAFQKTI